VPHGELPVIIRNAYLGAPHRETVSKAVQYDEFIGDHSFVPQISGERLGQLVGPALQLLMWDVRKQVW